MSRWNRNPGTRDGRDDLIERAKIEGVRDDGDCIEHERRGRGPLDLRSISKVSEIERARELGWMRRAREQEWETHRLREQEFERERARGREGERGAMSMSRNSDTSPHQSRIHARMSDAVFCRYTEALVHAPCHRPICCLHTSVVVF